MPSLAQDARTTATPVADSLEELARIGAGPDGGVTRPAWSAELREAYRWVERRMREAGLEVSVDAAGNLLGRWEAGRGRAVLVGSHLDTVPSGGRFDGALGVVAAVHAARMLRDSGFEPCRPLWIAAFMDEEGSRFGTATFGSRAFAGDALDGLGDRVDEAGVTLREAMASWGRDIDRAASARRIDQVAEYLELHIEQGPVLEAQRCEIGAVTSIVGLRGFRARLEGEAAHAGTTPMRARRDALIGAARVAIALRDHAVSRHGVTANVGKVAVEPGGPNVVPGTAEFTIDVRAQSGRALEELARAVEQILARVAGEERLEYELEPTFALEPVELDPDLVAAVERAAARAGARVMRVASGAGHDAMVIGRYVPAGMLFVPSRRGISHSPAELTTAEDVETGARVLYTLLRARLGDPEGGG